MGANVEKRNLIKMSSVFFVLLTLLSIIFTTGSTVSFASEVNESANEDVLVANDKWKQMVRETNTPEFKMVLNTRTPEQKKVIAQNILEKYDGAEIKATDWGQRLQNGGWNVYYKSAAKKQVTRTAYNGMGVIAKGGGGASAILGSFAVDSGVAAVAGVAAFVAAFILKTFGEYCHGCRDNVDAHGNTGTARITLTEHRWNKEYNHAW